MSNFEKVGKFMKTFGQEVKNEAKFPEEKIVNLRYDLILEELADDAELEKVIMMEELAIEYFSTSLPFLKRAYKVKPNDKSIIQGIVAVYYSLNEMENYVKYANILKKLNAETQIQKN